MVISKLIEFLLKQDQNLDLSILMPDCGGYDVESVKLVDPVIVHEPIEKDSTYHTEDVYYIADSSIEEVWEKL